MKGLQQVARRAILAALKGDAGVTALIERDQIHSQAPIVPVVWPFVKLGRPTSVPIKATCLDGAIVTYPLSAFAKPRMQGSATVETAEDHASRIGAKIERALDCRGVDLMVGGNLVRIVFQIGDMLLQQDGAEAGAFHYACTVRCRMTAE